MSTKNASILVVDDNPDAVELVSRILSSAGYRVRTASGVAEAVAALAVQPADIVVTDLRMPQASGIDLVHHVRENLPNSEVMVVTGYPSIETAVESIKSGADEYLAKPYTDEELLDAVSQCLTKLSLRRNMRQRLEGEGREPFGLIGESQAMSLVYRSIEKAATSKATVLISGESGTGKELVARAIHYNSKRAAAPFVAVNCGGIPENLLESELFGHVKGAFTGASESRAGFFVTADRGSIFLDEISETSLAMQVKLLRVLQEREVCMVGSSKTRPVDVRVLAATNRSLAQAVARGAFREELFFRINVLSIELPPLRERGDDIFLLARAFVERYARENERETPKFSDRCLRALRRYDWPGNVRELDNVIQRMVVMSDTDVLDASDLPEAMRFSPSPCPPTDLSRSLAEVESDYIKQVLESVEGNKSRAAKILGIDRKTLRLKLAR